MRSKLCRDLSLVKSPEFFQLNNLDKLPEVETDAYHPHHHSTVEAKAGGLQKVGDEPGLQRKDGSKWKEPW